jgi:hypothetical protein
MNGGTLLLEALAILNRRYPPDGWHAIVVGEMTDANGITAPRLILQMAVRGLPTVILGPEDFERTPEALADDITGLMVEKGIFPRKDDDDEQ